MTTQYKKARRMMLNPAPDMRGFNSLVKISLVQDGAKHVAVPVKRLYAQIGFDLGNGIINIHSDTIAGESGWEMYNNYIRKLRLLMELVVRTEVHLKSKDDDRFIVREFLNRIEDGNNFGASVLFEIPKNINKYQRFCVLEISNCHKKVRINPTRKEFLKIVTKMANHIAQHISDTTTAYSMLGNK